MLIIPKAVLPDTHLPLLPAPKPEPSSPQGTCVRSDPRGESLYSARIKQQSPALFWHNRQHADEASG